MWRERERAGRERVRGMERVRAWAKRGVSCDVEVGQLHT